MKSFVLISAICIQLGWSHAEGGYSNGVGAFSYQDSSGNRYGGTYGLKDGEVVDTKGTFPPDFSPPTFQDPDDFTGFFPEYFRNLENLLQDPGFKYNLPTAPSYYLYPYPTPVYNSIPNYGSSVYDNIHDYYSAPAFSYPNYNNLNHNLNRAFQANLESQKLALDAAHKAYDLTSNQAGFIPNLNPSRLTPFNDYSGFGAGGFPNMPNIPQFSQGFPFEGGIPMPNFGNAANGAYAQASVGPGYKHQVAAVNPSNPLSPNINLKSTGSGIPGGYRSVSASSFSSSSDINGKKTKSEGARTIVNEDGVITSYSVHNP